MTRAALLLALLATTAQAQPVWNGKPTEPVGPMVAPAPAPVPAAPSALVPPKLECHPSIDARGHKSWTPECSPMKRPVVQSKGWR